MVQNCLALSESSLNVWLYYRLGGDNEEPFQEFVLMSSAMDKTRYRKQYQLIIRCLCCRSTAPGSGGIFRLLGDGRTRWVEVWRSHFKIFLCVRFSAHCVNTVIESNDEEKDEIQVVWVAPPPRSGCVRLRAAVRQHG